MSRSSSVMRQPRPALSAHNTTAFPFLTFLALGPDSARELVRTQRVKNKDFSMDSFNYPCRGVPETRYILNFKSRELQE